MRVRALLAIRELRELNKLFIEPTVDLLGVHTSDLFVNQIAAEEEKRMRDRADRVSRG